ncbi:YezD family protein [Heliorestis convoluta]|uniref:DUF2292 domain-containing protein n=1 Tax=Heliorestis convoluta TaxID=356322 RepID=A0A5Q2N1B8_9FIRM|nr:YezD family protein [Heliorestis convoluta]QGG47609.1 hypothetical protein FTV88_1462 [Heliorestis convoluta]
MIKKAVTSKEQGQLKEAPDSLLYQHLEKMLASLRYGTITLVVQDGQVIQLEKNEKIRLK